MERPEGYEKVIESITKNLVDFGYVGLPESEVLESYDRAINGQDPQGIIDMFVKGQLEENGLL